MKQIKEEYYGKIEEFLNTYISENGISPSYSEMEKVLGIPKATLSRYISRMKVMGIISASGHRTTRTRENTGESGKSITAPIFDTVRCGVTDMPETDILDYVKLPVSLFGNNECFIVTAHGTSMTNAGIDDGDTLVVRRSSVADKGDIVIALYDEGSKTTCKYYDPNRNDGLCYLRAASDLDEDIIVPMSDVSIQGILTNIIKKPLDMKYAANEYKN